MHPVTQQLSLLNQPRARKNDRATSKAAASSVQHVSGYLENQIVATVAMCGHVTAEHIARTLLQIEPGRWDEGTIRSAVSRVAKRGHIIPAGEGKTSRGSRATTWKTAP